MSSAEYSCKLLKAIFCIAANSVDPDQTAPKGAVRSGSTLFAKMFAKKRMTIVVIGALRVKG